MSRDEIIAACQQCWKAEMEPRLLESLGDSRIVRVDCIPKIKEPCK